MRHKLKWENNSKINFREIGSEFVSRFVQAQGKVPV
jgi:hypothetical protein